MHSQLDLDETLYNYYYNTPDAHAIVRAFFRYDEVTKVNKINEAIKDKKIKITAQNTACEAQDDIHAGSAKGDFNCGAICISYEKLKKVSPKILNEEVFALLIHEISHLAGFDEDQAIALQKLMITHPEIYRDSGSRTGTTTATIFCDHTILEKEDNKVDEDKLVVFAKKSKLIIETVKFEKLELEKMLMSNATGEAYAQMANQKTTQDKFMAALNIANADTVISSLTARSNTNAYCSPKALIANILANIPDVLEMKCGDIDTVNSLEKIKARINEELKILKEEK